MPVMFPECVSVVRSDSRSCRYCYVSSGNRTCDDNNLIVNPHTMLAQPRNSFVRNTRHVGGSHVCATVKCEGWAEIMHKSIKATTYVRDTSNPWRVTQ